MVTKTSSAIWSYQGPPSLLQSSPLSRSTQSIRREAKGSKAGGGRREEVEMEQQRGGRQSGWEELQPQPLERGSQKGALQNQHWPEGHWNGGGARFLLPSGTSGLSKLLIIILKLAKPVTELLLGGGRGISGYWVALGRFNSLNCTW